MFSQASEYCHSLRSSVRTHHDILATPVISFSFGQSLVISLARALCCNCIRRCCLLLFRFGDSELWLVMDLAEEGTLRDYVARAAAQGQESGADAIVEERLHLAKGAAAALKYLHDRKVQHRDIKTPNLLLSRDGSGRLTVKMGDFGLSRCQALITATASSSSGGRSIGSPRWSSPEQLKREPYTDKSDVYSLGVVLWEILTLQLPWGESDTMQIITAMLMKKQLELPDAQTLPASLDPLHALVASCISHNSDARPTAKQVCQALFGKGVPFQAAPYIASELGHSLNSSTTHPLTPQAANDCV